jgi:hypothetical protein
MNKIAKLKEYFRGFLFPQIELTEWADMHDLSLTPIECPICSEKLHPRIPFASKDMRGIIFDQCSCEEYPKDQAPFLFCSADPKKRQERKRLAESLVDYLN